jgi:hypothetical protein
MVITHVLSFVLLSCRRAKKEVPLDFNICTFCHLSGMVVVVVEPHYYHIYFLEILYLNIENFDKPHALEHGLL